MQTYNLRLLYVVLQSVDTLCNMVHNAFMFADESIKKKLAKKIGLAIKHYRSNRNISQEKLACAIEADRTYISALERGNKIASVYCPYKLSKELNVNFKDLFDFTL